jgi:hypothetical protein
VKKGKIWEFLNITAWSNKLHFEGMFDAQTQTKYCAFWTQRFTQKSHFNSILNVKISHQKIQTQFPVVFLAPPNSKPIQTRLLFGNTAIFYETQQNIKTFPNSISNPFLVFFTFKELAGASGCGLVKSTLRFVVVIFGSRERKMWTKRAEKDIILKCKRLGM